MKEEEQLLRANRLGVKEDIIHVSETDDGHDLRDAAHIGEKTNGGTELSPVKKKGELATRRLAFFWRKRYMNRIWIKRNSYFRPNTNRLELFLYFFLFRLLSFLHQLFRKNRIVRNF